MRLSNTILHEPGRILKGLLRGLRDKFRRTMTKHRRLPVRKDLQVPYLFFRNPRATQPGILAVQPEVGCADASIMAFDSSSRTAAQAIGELQSARIRRTSGCSSKIEANAASMSARTPLRPAFGLDLIR